MKKSHSPIKKMTAKRKSTPTLHPNAAKLYTSDEEMDVLFRALAVVETKKFKP